MVTRTKNTNLLSSSEKTALTKIAKESTPNGQRAKALLGVNDGLTQVNAGIAAGLTRDQVKYWLAKFKIARLSIFPEKVANSSGASKRNPVKKIVSSASTEKKPTVEKNEKKEEAPMPTLKEKKGKKDKKKKGKKSNKKKGKMKKDKKKNAKKLKGGNKKKGKKDKKKKGKKKKKK